MMINTIHNSILRRIGCIATCFACSAVASDAQNTGTSIFSDSERAALVTFWAAPGRLQQSVPQDAQSKGIWQVRLTPDGSAWLLKYQNAIGAKGAPPTAAPAVITVTQSDKVAWKQWVQNRIAADRARAQASARASNEAFMISAPAPSIKLGGPQAARTGQADIGQLPEPGPIPPTLLAAIGNAPPFAAAVVPMQYVVTFEDGEAYKYTDNPAMSPSYAYYRFPQGVAVYNAPAGDGDTREVFAAAGLTESEQRVAAAVSRLEGSFESINTYDTGFVSVGFLQFITFEDGKHSLAEVLNREKADKPDAFATDFHKYGIDMSPDGVITAVDPNTGAELIGPEAVHKIVDDKRLIAVFQRAGRHSRAFRVAQVMIAKSRYWPADDAISIQTGPKVLTGKISDVVRSEAGIATLFDRKVNRGTCAPIADVVAKVMRDHGLTRLKDACVYELEIVKALKYRGDFLADATLSQPAANSGADNADVKAPDTSAEDQAGDPDTAGTKPLKKKKKH